MIRCCFAVALAGLLVPLTAAPSVAAPVQPSVRVEGPAVFEPGREHVISVTVGTAVPEPEDTFAPLVVRVPALLPVLSVDADGFECFVNELGPTLPTDITCFVPGGLLAGSTAVVITVGVEPGDVAFDSIDASLRAGGEVAEDSLQVEIPGTPSELSVAIDLPDQVRFGERFTVVVTAGSTRPVTDAVVSVAVDLPERLTAESATAPGLTCAVRDSTPGGADCTGSELSGSLTVTLTVTVGPGAATNDNVRTFFTVNNSQQFASESIVILGSLPTTTVSGRVWNDLDRDGRQDNGEPGMPAVPVAAQFSSARTGPDGRYTLTGVENGEHVVQFGLSGRFDYTRPNVGDDRHDSDVVDNTRECEDCNAGFAPVTVDGPTSFVDAGVFDPSVPVPSAGASVAPSGNPPQAGPVRDLPTTGTPAAALLVAAAALVAAGTGLTALTRRG